jgi:toxin YoeB
MNNFFLLNEAVDLKDYDQFKNGMLELNAIEKNFEDDIFLKHESVWYINIINLLYTTYEGSEQAIIKFIEQLQTINTNICNQVELEQKYPNELNAFLGIDFLNTPIVQEKQVRDFESFHYAKRHYYVNLQCNGNKDKLRICLKQLYEKHQFEDQALDDLTYWNQKNFPLYLRIHDLLVDIIDNPFQGGIGKTEVLKNQKGIASKRIDDANRITYYLKDKSIHVVTCKGHYD